MWPGMVFIPSSRVRVPLHHFIKLHHKTYVGKCQVRPCLKYRSKVLEVVWSQLRFPPSGMYFAPVIWFLAGDQKPYTGSFTEKQFVDGKIRFVGTVLIVATLSGLKAVFPCERWSLQSCVDVNPPRNVFQGSVPTGFTHIFVFLLVRCVLEIC